ncbi:conserved hypothetical protein [Rubrivivax sp. A210]|uniref:hypothetical protein n=1 Tax=Rubrivivax sp. A210 TaxID=2772301 RepID=UPI0019189586|nr:hypothetical protein [Rubrivivax sp. A210]CAD5374061.1 conserved hypothetical protein [Rubrivivax sp. A210]
MKRRTLLTVGVAGAALLTLVGGSLALLRPARREGRLTETGRTVFTALAPAVLDAMLPPPGAAREAAVAALLMRIEASLAGMPPALQAEVDELIMIIASAPGRLALVGLRPAWSEATAAEVGAALQGLRESGLAVRQQVFHALRDLTNAAYFADAATWSAIGYPGQRAVA